MNMKNFGLRDLLNRPLKSGDHEMIRNHFTGKTVLVSGAGGSIGSEICHQAAKFGVRKLIMVDASEFNLYQVDLMIREFESSGLEVHSILQSAADGVAMRRLFKSHRPDTVIHAAAFKHVPLVESNPIAGIMNNISSTITLAQAALDFNVGAFLLISSDKAVNPTNVMGLTKRCCELIIQALDRSHPGRVRFMAVRFGNVLASSGSVIPRFRQQIESGGPVTVTHKEVTRYFMMIEEAVGLVLQSLSMADGGEVFVLNMGDPVRIYELAERMILASGSEPHVDIKIVITGLRPGEKMYEELILAGDEVATENGNIFVAIPEPIDPGNIMASIRNLLDVACMGDAEACTRSLRDIVYHGNATSTVIPFRAPRTAQHSEPIMPSAHTAHQTLAETCDSDIRAS